MSKLRVVGKNVQRLDAYEKVTGKAMYCADLRLPGMLCAKILRSPYPHAKILNIDISRAKALKGVKAVLSGQDIPTERIGLSLRDRPVLAQGVTRFVGEPVVAIAANNEEVAEEALSIVKVDYEELPAIFDPEESMKSKPRVIIHPELFTYTVSPLLKFMKHKFNPDMPNCFIHHKIRQGNLEQGFQEADVIVENRFSTARIQHAAMEPHSAIAKFESNGALTLWSTEQAVWRHKYELCRVFNLSTSKLRLIGLYIGGGFGGKSNMQQVTAPAVLLALRTRSPVNLTLKRNEVFSDGFVGCPMIINIKDGLKKDGTLTAREMKLVLDSGAYSGTTIIIANNAGFGATSTYKAPHFKLDSYAVATNNPPGGPFRGFGVRQVNWAVESQMDMIAEKLDIDPLELRKRNLLKEGEINACGEIVHSIGAKQCLEKIAERIHWHHEASTQRDGPWRKGKGLALGNKYTTGGTSSVALVKVHDDATIEVRHSAAELGQGCNTVFAQIAAEEFGVSADKINVIYTDTGVTPYDWATVSSRATFHVGNAVRLACKDAKQQVLELASKKMNTSLQDLAIRDGYVHAMTEPDKSVGINDIFMDGGFVSEGGEILGKATYTCPRSKEDPETGQGERLVASYTYGACGAEVSVNTETGSVRIDRICGCFDMGRAINPKLCEAQIESGLGMGIGSSIYEELITEHGKVMNPNLADYRVPTFMQIPLVQNIYSDMTPVPHKDGPYGAKGIGETAAVPVAPAIANAVYNAVRIRIKDLPISAEKCLKANKGTQG